MPFQVAISSCHRCHSAVLRFLRVVRSGHWSSSSATIVCGFIGYENPLSTSKSSTAFSVCVCVCVYGVRFPFYNVPRVYIVIRVCTVFVLAGWPNGSPTLRPSVGVKTVRRLCVGSVSDYSAPAMDVHTTLRVGSFRCLHDGFPSLCSERTRANPIRTIYIYVFPIYQLLKKNKHFFSIVVDCRRKSPRAPHRCSSSTFQRL